MQHTRMPVHGAFAPGTILAFPSGRRATPSPETVQACAARERCLVADIIAHLELVVCRLTVDYWRRSMPLDLAVAFDAGASLLNRHHDGGNVSYGEASDVSFAIMQAVRQEVRPC